MLYITPDYIKLIEIEYILDKYIQCLNVVPIVNYYVDQKIVKYVLISHLHQIQERNHGHQKIHLGREM